MTRVTIKSPDQFERALGVFKREILNEGLVRELRRRQAFVSPSEDRREKQRRAKVKQSRTVTPRDPRDGKPREDIKTVGEKRSSRTVV